MSRDCRVALPHSAIGMAAVYDPDISLSLLLTIFEQARISVDAQDRDVKNNA